MSDDKNIRSGQDRNRVAGEQEWEVSYVMGKLNVSREEVEEAIRAVGNSREKVEEYLRNRLRK